MTINEFDLSIGNIVSRLGALIAALLSIKQVPVASLFPDCCCDLSFLVAA